MPLTEELEPGLMVGKTSHRSLCPTAQGLPELGGELLDNAIRLHIEDVVVQRDAGHQLQGAHVSTIHSDSVDLNA